MTNEQILEIAAEASGELRLTFSPSQIREFVELVAAATREECAKACQGVVDGGMYDGWQQYAAAACRDAIRAMNEKGAA